MHITSWQCAFFSCLVAMLISSPPVPRDAVLSDAELATIRDLYKKRVVATEPLSVDQLQQYHALFLKSLSDMVRVRPKWPRGVPLRYRLQYRALLRQEVPGDFAVAPLFSGASVFAVPTLPFGRTELMYAPEWNDLTVVAGDVSSCDSGQMNFAVLHSDGVGAGECDINVVSIELVDTVEEAIRPNNTEKITRLVRSGLRAVIREKSGLCVSIPDSEILSDVCLALRITLSKDNVVLGAGSIYNYHPSEFELEPSMTRTLSSGAPLHIEWRAGATLASAVANQDSVIVHITGDAELALNDFAKSQYWSGAVEMTLQELLKRE